MSYKNTEQRRLSAMSLLEQGWSGSKIARHFGVTSGAISQWKAAYRRYGPEGLKATPHTGRPPKLTASQLKRLEKLLLQSPEKYGYANDLWTLPRVAAVIQKHFGVPYDTSGVWHVLVRMGWSCQKPERRARERDEDAIAAWRKNDWLRIKKRQEKRQNHCFH